MYLSSSITTERRGDKSLKPQNMKKVYLVWYDNGATYPEDHQTYIDRIFLSKESADKYVSSKNNLPDDDEESFYNPRWVITDKQVED